LGEKRYLGGKGTDALFRLHINLTLPGNEAGVPLSNFSRRKITHRYAALKMVGQDEERISLIPSIKGRVDSMLLTAQVKTARRGEGICCAGMLLHSWLP
jgi:hypothetical protein